MNNWRLQQAEWEVKHPFNAKLDKIVPRIVAVVVAVGFLIKVLLSL